MFSYLISNSKNSVRKIGTSEIKYFNGLTMVPRPTMTSDRPTHYDETLSHLAPDTGHTLYHTLSHLVPDFVTPCTRLCHTLYQTLSHLVPDPANTLYQYTAREGPSEARPHASSIKTEIMSGVEKKEKTVLFIILEKYIYSAGDLVLNV